MDQAKIAHLEADLQAARRKGDTDDVARLEKAIAAERAVPDAPLPPRVPDPVPPRGPDPAATFAIPAPRQPAPSPADAAALKAHGDLLGRISALEAGQAVNAAAIAELRAAPPKTP